MKGDDLEFDLIGLDASIANAFRRILIGEVGGMLENSSGPWNLTSQIRSLQWLLRRFTF